MTPQSQDYRDALDWFKETDGHNLLPQWVWQSVEHALTLPANAGWQPAVPQEVVDALINALKEANEVTRSAHSIASRRGKDTNWKSFKRKVDDANWSAFEALALLNATGGE